MTCRFGVAFARASAVGRRVPSAWLRLCCVPVVARLAQPASGIGVVGVEALLDELAPAERVVVGDGGVCGVALGAYRVAC